MPQENVFGHIYVDLITAVVRNCNTEIDATGRDALFKFISKAVVAEVEGGGDYFGDRNYYIKRFSAIAGHLDDDVPPERAATRDDVIAACQKEVGKVLVKIEEMKADAAALGAEFGTDAVTTRICLQFQPDMITPTPSEASEP